MPRTQRKTKNKVHLERLQNISEIVRRQISFAQLPWTLGDLREGLVEECLALCIAAGLLERPVDPVAVTKLVRRRLRKEWKEFRWWAQDENGKQVRRGKSVLVLKQPVQIQDDESPEDSWSEPLEEVCSDSQGKFCGSSSDNRNGVEGRMVERLDALAKLTKLSDIVGVTNLDWMIAYVDGKHDGTPLSKSARNRFAYLKKKVIQSFGLKDGKEGVGEESPRHNGESDEDKSTHNDTRQTPEKHAGSRGIARPGGAPTGNPRGAQEIDATVSQAVA